MIILVIIFAFILLCKIEVRDINIILPQKVFNDGKLESVFDYTVYWRRSLIISIVILLISIAVGIISCNLKSCLTFLVISMLIIYFQFNFYNYHQDKYIVRSFNCVYDDEKSLNIASLEKPFLKTR